MNLNEMRMLELAGIKLDEAEVINEPLYKVGDKAVDEYGEYTITDIFHMHGITGTPNLFRIEERTYDNDKLRFFQYITTDKTPKAREINADILDFINGNMTDNQLKKYISGLNTFNFKHGSLETLAAFTGGYSNRLYTKRVKELLQKKLDDLGVELQADITKESLDNYVLKSAGVKLDEYKVDKKGDPAEIPEQIVRFLKNEMTDEEEKEFAIWAYDPFNQYLKKVFYDGDADARAIRKTIVDKAENILTIKDGEFHLDPDVPDYNKRLWKRTSAWTKFLIFAGLKQSSDYYDYDSVTMHYSHNPKFKRNSITGDDLLTKNIKENTIDNYVLKVAGVKLDEACTCGGKKQQCTDCNSDPCVCEACQKCGKKHSCGTTVDESEVCSVCKSKPCVCEKNMVDEADKDGTVSDETTDAEASEDSDEDKESKVETLSTEDALAALLKVKELSGELSDETKKAIDDLKASLEADDDDGEEETEECLQSGY